MKNVLKTLIFMGLINSLPLSAYAEKNKIVVWAMGYEGTKIGIMARRFEKEYPDIEVVTQSIPWDAAHEKLLTSIIGGVPPDISQMGTTWLPEFQSMAAFEPLDDYLKNSSLKEVDFFSSSFGIGKIKSKIYGIPWYVDTRVLFYRKDILKQAGYSRPPQTWDEFLEIAGKITHDSNSDGVIDHFGIALPVKDEQLLLPFVWQNNGAVLNPDRSIAVKQDKFAEGVQQYKKFFLNKSAPVEDPGYDLKWAFREGIYPMFISGPWMIDQINREIPEIRGKWGVSMLPGNKTRTSFVGGCHLVIFKDSPNKEAAWKFVEFMSRPENQIEWFKIAGGLPANRRSWTSGFFEDKPLVKVFGDQMADTNSPPNIPEWEEMASAIKQRMEEYIMAKSSISEMQELLYEDFKAILQGKDKGSKHVILWFSGINILMGIGIVFYIRRLRLKQGQIPHVLKAKVNLEQEVPGGMPEKGIRRKLIPWLFIFPSLAALLIFLFFPIFSSFLISLTNWNIYTFSDLSGLRFIGLGNYMDLLKDKVFWQALLNTVIYSGVGIPLNIVLALFIAVLIDKKYIKTKAIFRGGYFMPVVTTLVAVAVVWRWMYNPEYGLINYLIGFLGIDKQTWLSNPYLALPALIIMSVWKNFGYNMVIILAGLQTIPRSLYESASVDGADAWQTFWNITFPCLKPTLFFVTIMTTIGSFQFFAEPYIMTKGGPLNRTLSMVMYMYNQGFKFFKFGYGTALAYILFVCILIFTVIQVMYRKKMEAK